MIEVLINLSDRKMADYVTYNGEKFGLSSLCNPPTLLHIIEKITHSKGGIYHGSHTI